MFLVLDDDRFVDTAAIADALESARNEPPPIIDTGVSANPGEVMGGLGLWLVLGDPDAGHLSALGVPNQETSMPIFAVDEGFMRTVVLVGADGLAALVKFDREITGASEHRLGVLPVYPHGYERSSLAMRLVAHVRDWDRAGRPRSTDLKMSVYPASSSPLTSVLPPQEPGTPAPNRFVITKPQSRIVIDW